MYYAYCNTVIGKLYLRVDAGNKIDAENIIKTNYPGAINVIKISKRE